MPKDQDNPQGKRVAGKQIFKTVIFSVNMGTIQKTLKLGLPSTLSTVVHILSIVGQ